LDHRHLDRRHQRSADHGQQAVGPLAEAQGGSGNEWSANFWGAFPAWAGAGDALASWMTLTKGISGFFEPHTRAFLGAHIYLGADQAG
jgi:hypothetical protein